MADLGILTKKYSELLTEEVGFVSGHIIIGLYEQAQQKILEELNELLFKSVLG